MVYARSSDKLLYLADPGVEAYTLCIMRHFLSISKNVAERQPKI